MKLLIHLKNFLRNFICNSNCCSSNTSYSGNNDICKCDLCENFKSYNNIEDEDLHIKEEQPDQQKIYRYRFRDKKADSFWFRHRKHFYRS